MVPDPIQSPTLDLAVTQNDGLPNTTTTIDLDDSRTSGNETPEQAEARNLDRQRISSGIRLTEREQFQMYKAETGQSNFRLL